MRCAGDGEDPSFPDIHCSRRTMKCADLIQMSGREFTRGDKVKFSEYWRAFLHKSISHNENDSPGFHHADGSVSTGNTVESL